MFGLGKRLFGSAKNSGPTYKERVADFWQWFSSQAGRFHHVISDGKSESLFNEMAREMDERLPGMAWCFGPGDEAGEEPRGESTHSLTLTGEGFLPKQLLADYWLAERKEIPGWLFHGHKKASSRESLMGMEIGLNQDNRKVDASGIIVATVPNADEKKFDITCWHPEFESLPEKDRLQIVFLFLDEALGEFGVEQWIGVIDVEPPETDAKTTSLIGLPSFLEHARKYHSWDVLNPLETYSVYSLPTQDRRKRRGDTIAGNTQIMSVLSEFLERGKSLKDDSLRKLGAEIAYLRFPSSNLVEGQEADTRGEIEDAMNQALRRERSGRALGGAIGTEQTYVDLLLLDGEVSRQIVLETARRLDLQGDIAIETIL
jgi:hypothetical protein